MKKKNEPEQTKQPEQPVQTQNLEELTNLKVQLARALADYDNLRKRSEDERGIWIKVATQNVVQKLLPVLDTLETAQKHLNDPGLAIAASQLKVVFGEEGLVEIDPKISDEFNPELHEAIDSEENSENSGKIAEVYAKGWKFNEGMVVRYAKVKVYK